MSCANSSCKDCNGTCDIKQNLCSISSEYANAYGGAFSWPTSPLPTTVPIVKVWTAAAWNQLRNAITAAYNRGSECNSAGESFGPNPMQAVSVNTPITADIFNSAKDAINKLGGNVETVTGGPTGTIIRAYHAVTMASGYNEGKISVLACDTCNTQCDVTCDGCIGCDECQGVQHYSTCYGSCDSP